MAEPGIVDEFAESSVRLVQRVVVVVHNFRRSLGNILVCKRVVVRALV